MTSGSLTSFVNVPNRPDRAVLPLNIEHQVHSLRRDHRIPKVYGSNPRSFDIAKFAKYHNLCAVYEWLKQHGGQAAGVDGITFSDVSNTERNAILKQIARELTEGTYCPGLTREVPVPKGTNGGTRQLAIPTLFDRVVMKALLLCLNDYWRRILSGYGRDVWLIYAIMQQAIWREQKYVLAIDEIRNCYPSAPIEQVLHTQQSYLNQPDLMSLVERIIRGQCGPHHTTGLEQGSPYSPVAMESFLHNSLDTVMTVRFPGLTQLRYVDNTTYLCRDSNEGEQILQTANEILSEAQLRLKREDGPPQDIRDPNHNRTLLGLIPNWTNGEIQLSIPESAYSDLDTGMTMTKGSPKPVMATRRTMLGWINAVGPTLTNSIAPGIVDRVSSMALQKGFREFSRSELLNTAREARKRWLNLTRRYSR